MIEIDGICARHGDFRLQEVSLRVEPGTSLVVLGPSGSGKTLLLETVLGLRPHERGRVLIDGVDVAGQPPERRGMSYLPQDVALFPHLSVLGNILFGTHGRRFRHDVRDELDRLLDLLHIRHLANRRDVRSLSGGESQRVALARALIVRPRILVLDESFSALDEGLRRQLQEEFAQLRHALGLTVLMVTHDQEEAFLLADRLAILVQGRVIQEAAPEELYAHPVNCEVARFLGITNLLPVDRVESNGEHTVCQIGQLQLTAAPSAAHHGITHVGFSPTEVTIGQGSAGAGANRLTATVVSSAYLGHRRKLKLAVEGAPGIVLDCILTPQPGSASDLAEGLQVPIEISPACLRLFGE